MALHLTVGETHTIPLRDVTDHMIATRDRFLSEYGLPLDTADPSPANTVHRADIHPRLLPGQEEDVPHGANVVSTEIADGGVVVTAKAPGHAFVHVIDEASAPGAVEYEFIVARTPRTGSSEEAQP